MFKRATKRATKHATNKRATTKRSTKGGNYETDVIRMDLEGQPIKAPHEVVMVRDGQVTSVAAFLRKQDDAILHGHSAEV